MSGEHTRGSYEPKLGSHLPALDALRGIAILLVTGYRFNIGPEDSSRLGHAVTRVLGLGTCGVDLFFVLSGFLITGILFDARGSDHYFRNFYMRRVLRIFPLYYGVLLLVFVLLPHLGAFFGAQTHQGWLWFYGTNVYLAQENSWKALGAFAHFWSLAVEEHFYLFWPFVIYLLPRRVAMAACVACVVIATACRAALVWAGDYAVAVDALTPCRLDALAIGAFLALAARGMGGIHALVRPTAILASISGLVLIAFEFKLGKWLGMSQASLLAVELGLYPLVFGGVLIQAVRTDPSAWIGKLWNAPFLRFFGKYSYGIYVFQNLMIPLGSLAFTVNDLVSLTGSVFLGKMLYLGIMTGLTVAVALASWHLFEKHFLRLKDAFSTNRKAAIRTESYPCPITLASSPIN